MLWVDSDVALAFSLLWILLVVLVLVRLCMRYWRRYAYQIRLILKGCGIGILLVLAYTVTIAAIYTVVQSLK